MLRTCESQGGEDGNEPSETREFMEKRTRVIKPEGREVRGIGRGLRMRFLRKYSW